MSFNQFVKSMSGLYVKSLYIIVPFTASIGFSSGLVETIARKPNEDKLTSFDVFSNIIGFTTMGVVTGITYPITFPVLLHETLNK